MIDIFLRKDASVLLKNKNIVFMGDSNIRALYKDALCLLKLNKLIPQKVLKTKGELSCFGDELLSRGPRYNGREYREERKVSYDNTRLSFYFLTRVYDNYVKKILKELSKNQQNMPDVLIVNSCLWDVTRWGPNGVEPYKKKLILLMKDLKQRMPDCLVIWVTAPPLACDPSGGVFVKEIEFFKYSIRFHVVEANHYARKVVVDHGFDVVDAHFHLKLQIHRRTPDGIHWKPNAVRYVTNLLLTHISIAWNVSLPHRFKPGKLEENPTSVSEEEDTITPKKVSSVIVKPNNPVKCTSDKPKENNKNKADIFTTPQKPKKRKKPLKEKNGNFQESHHSYLKRKEFKERQNRIRQWEKPVQNLSSNMKLHGPKNYSNNHLEFHAHCSPNRNQQDFGYYSNNESYNTYTQQGFIDSPRHIPVSPNSYQNPHNAIVNSPSNHVSYTYGQRRFIDSPRQIPLTPNSYQNPHVAIFSSPPSSYTYDQQRFIDSPRHIPLPLNPYRKPSNALLNTPPYSGLASDYWSPPPHDYSLQTNNWLHFQPQIDFSATNSVPFGLQF